MYNAEVQQSPAKADCILLKDLSGLSNVQSASSICLEGCHALLESQISYTRE